MEGREGIYRIMLAINRIDGIYEKLSREMGVKANMTWILYALDDGKPHSQKQICEEWLIPKTTLNTIVKELESEGCVTLNTIPGQRRERNVSLTEKGKVLARQTLDSIYQAEQEAFDETEGTGMLMEALDRLGQNLEHSFQKISVGREGQTGDRKLLE